jgi:hypothetical protein
LAAKGTPGYPNRTPRKERTCATLYQEALIAATLLTSAHILDELEAKLVHKAGLEPAEVA